MIIDEDLFDKIIDIVLIESFIVLQIAFIILGLVIFGII